jgi:hypothetical protein
MSSFFWSAGWRFKDSGFSGTEILNFDLICRDIRFSTREKVAKVVHDGELKPCSNIAVILTQKWGILR